MGDKIYCDRCGKHIKEPDERNKISFWTTLLIMKHEVNLCDYCAIQFGCMASKFMKECHDGNDDKY